MSNSVEKVLQITGTHDHTVKKSENRIKVEITKEEPQDEPQEVIMNFHITEKK